ncbi:MAG: pyruvate dehydrogenase (acetyl-transferring) E1 component subunit alpha [Gammaproteobacteria bacterium]|nr:MAG: pyruvate dehydrogenase (acetyl-transferring) E1 component subunit alpha [Gammaproteobacteria bacterium]
MYHHKTFDFFVSYYRFLNEKGEVEQELPAWAADRDRVLSAYRTMVRVRQFDQKAIALQRTGKLGTYASVLGQEAIGTAIGQWMRADDVLAPYYRDLAAQIQRGMSFTESLLYWGGDERGSAFGNCAEDLPNCVPIATQMTHGAGIATAFKIRGEKRAAVATCGEGATSKGDFMETLNLAGAWQLPLVMVVNNNQWAISTPRKVQCGAQTFAQKAIGAGIHGVQVDGNDYFAIGEAVRLALEKAHQGKGPTLIEAVSYRLCDHTTADDASRYRPAEELKAAWQREPILRLRNWLLARGWWDEQQEKALIAEANTEIEEAVNAYLNTPPQRPESMFEHLYAEMPDMLRDQHAEVQCRAELEEGGAHHG